MEGEMDFSIVANMNSNDLMCLILMIFFMYASFQISYLVAMGMEKIGFLDLPLERLHEKKKKVTISK